MTVMAVYICMIDRIAISIAIIPMAEENGWSPTIQGAGVEMRSNSVRPWGSAGPS